MHIEKTPIFLKGRKNAGCTIEIPAQTVPVKAEKKAEGEFEAASYATEKNTFVKMKKFPKGFQEELNVEMEFSKIETNVVPSEHCLVEPGFKNEKGVIEAELEEIKVRNGNVGFETKKEVEEGI